MNRLSIIFGWILVIVSCIGCAHGQSKAGTLSIAIRIADSLHTITDSARFTKEELVSATGIEILVEDSDLDHGLKVVEFMLSTAMNDSLIAEAVSFNGDLTDEQRRVIDRAPSGSRMFLERIRVRNSLGSIHTAPTQVIRLR